VVTDDWRAFEAFSSLEGMQSGWAIEAEITGYCEWKLKDGWPEIQFGRQLAILGRR
jgi:hypothetical protein